MRLIIGFFLATVFLVSTAFKPSLADAAVPQINGNWLIDIRTLCAVGTVVLCGTWWLARWMQKVDDRLRAGEARFAVIELMATKREEMLTDIQQKVAVIANGQSEKTERKR